MDNKIIKLRTIIQSSNNIVFFGGAGVSTESNIPDFRSETGLYQAIKDYGFPPEAILSHSFFNKNTDIFFKYYKENLIYQDAKPNKAHLKLAELEKTGKLKAVITQNIDGLHQMAGSENVFELHGSIHKNTCISCGKKYNLDYILNSENTSNNIPKCNHCNKIVKPDVVLYEEPLTESVINDSVNAIANADTLIVGGTSLSVYPAASLIQYFRGENLILINKTKTPYDDKASLVIYGAIGEILSQV